MQSTRTLDEATLRTIVGQRVKRNRRVSGLTQAELASKTRLKRTSITNIEKGNQMVSLTALYEIAAVLDIDVSSLLPSTTAVVSETREDVAQKVVRASHDSAVANARSTNPEVLDFVSKTTSGG